MIELTLDVPQMGLKVADREPYHPVVVIGCAAGGVSSIQSFREYYFNEGIREGSLLISVGGVRCDTMRDLTEIGDIVSGQDGIDLVFEVNPQNMPLEVMVDQAAEQGRAGVNGMVTPHKNHRNSDDDLFSSSAGKKRKKKKKKEKKSKKTSTKKTVGKGRGGESDEKKVKRWSRNRDLARFINCFIPLRALFLGRDATLSRSAKDSGKEGREKFWAAFVKLFNEETEGGEGEDEVLEHEFPSDEKFDDLDFDWSGYVLTIDTAKAKFVEMRTAIDKALTNFRQSGMGDMADEVKDVDMARVVFDEEGNQHSDDEEEDVDKDGEDEDDKEDSGAYEQKKVKFSLTIYSSSFENFVVDIYYLYFYETMMKYNLLESACSSMPTNATGGSGGVNNASDESKKKKRKKGDLSELADATKSVAAALGKPVVLSQTTDQKVFAANRRKMGEIELEQMQEDADEANMDRWGKAKDRLTTAQEDLESAEKKAGLLPSAGDIKNIARSQRYVEAMEKACDDAERRCMGNQGAKRNKA